MAVCRSMSLLLTSSLAALNLTGSLRMISQSRVASSMAPPPMITFSLNFIKTTENWVTDSSMWAQMPSNASMCRSRFCFAVTAAVPFIWCSSSLDVFQLQRCRQTVGIFGQKKLRPPCEFSWRSSVSTAGTSPEPQLAARMYAKTCSTQVGLLSSIKVGISVSTDLTRDLDDGFGWAELWAETAWHWPERGTWTSNVTTGTLIGPCASEQLARENRFNVCLKIATNVSKST